MQSNKTCPLVEQYLNYLIVIKGRSGNTIKEYCTDLLMFFRYVCDSQGNPIVDDNFGIIDLKFIRSILLNDIYSFIAYCQMSSAGTRARKIVSIRQFWKYLKTKAHLIDNNITEELETPNLPKRMPKYRQLQRNQLILGCKLETL